MAAIVKSSVSEVASATQIEKQPSPQAKTGILKPVPVDPLKNAHYFRTISKLGSGNQKNPDFLISIFARNYVNQAQIFQQSGEKQKALFCFEKALLFYKSLAWRFTEDHTHQALINRIIFCYEQIQILRPDDLPYKLAEAYIEKARMKNFSSHVRIEYWHKAQRVCRRLLKEKPMDVQTHLWAGRCSLKLGNVNKALVAFSNALTIGVDNVMQKNEAHFLLNKAIEKLKSKNPGLDIKSLIPNPSILGL